MTPRRKQLMEAYHQNKIPNVELLIDNVFDPHNVAAISRSADGFGIKTIHLYYTYNTFPKLQRVGKKSSGSATQWIHFNKIENLAEFVEGKKHEGYCFWGSGLQKPAHSLTQVRFPEKCIIVLGAESLGLSPEIQKICDERLYIPMVGVVESYNISVAAAVIMYEIYKQKGQHLKLSSEYLSPSPHRHAAKPFLIK